MQACLGEGDMAVLKFLFQQSLHFHCESVILHGMSHLYLCQGGAQSCMEAKYLWSQRLPNYQVGAWQCLLLLQCYLIPLAPVGLVLTHHGKSDKTVIPSYQINFSMYCVSSDILVSSTDHGYSFLQISSDQPALLH